MIDRAELLKLTPVADDWLDAINSAMAEHSITSGVRVAFFLATCLFESSALMKLSENLNYTAEGLLRVWPNRFDAAKAAEYAHKPIAIANYVYANRGGNGDEASGDGWRYRGQGPIQITFRNGYAAAEAGCHFDLLARPELLQQPIAGSMVSAWFWDVNHCNDAADLGDFAGTQGIVNRGSKTKQAENMEGRLLWLKRVNQALA